MGQLNSDQVKDFITSKNPIIMEIGAYRGDDTEVLLKTIPNSFIIAIEPDPRNIPYLYKLKDQYPVRLQICEMAISNIDSTNIKFYMSELNDNPDHANFSSSIMKPKLHLTQHPRIVFNRHCDVETTTLDTLYKHYRLKTIDFIWTDVQGAEHLVIEGGLNALKNTKYFYTEYANEEIYEGEVNLEYIKKSLPFMTLTNDYNTNALFKNSLL